VKASDELGLGLGLGGGLGLGLGGGLGLGRGGAGSGAGPGAGFGDQISSQMLPHSVASVTVANSAPMSPNAKVWHFKLQASADLPHLPGFTFRP